MSEGPAAGLVILDTVSADPRLARWPQLHIARAELLRRVGRRAEAVAAYQAAIALEPSAPERAFLARRISTLPARGDDPPEPPDGRKAT